MASGPHEMLPFARLLVLLAALGTGLPAPAVEPGSTEATLPSPSHWYLGLGLAAHRLDNDHPSLGSQGGGGFLALAGFTLGALWRLEASVSGGSVSADATCDPTVPESCTIYYPADSAQYANLLFLVRRDFPREGGWRPWVAVGLGSHYYDWSTYFYSVGGSGPVLQAGIEWPVQGRWSLRVDLTHATYKGDDKYDYGPYKGSTTQLGTAVVYSFR